MFGIVHFTCNITKPNFQGIFPSPYLSMLCFYPPWAAAQLLAQFWQTTWDEKSWPRFCYSNGTHGESQNKWRLQLSPFDLRARKIGWLYNSDANNHPTNSVRNQMAIKWSKMIKSKIYANSSKTKAVFEGWTITFSFNLEHAAQHVILGLWWNGGAFDGQCGSKFKTLNLPTFKGVSI